jgi:hypothetical protein
VGLVSVRCNPAASVAAAMASVSPLTSTPICFFLSSLYCCVLYPLVAPHCSLLHAYYFAVTVQVPAKLSPMAAAAAAAASPCAVCAAAPGLPLRVVHGIVGGGGLGVAKRPDRTRLPIGFCRRRRLGVQASNGAIPTGNFFRRPRSTTGTAPPFFNLGGEESKGPGGQQLQCQDQRTAASCRHG